MTTMTRVLLDGPAIARAVHRKPQTIRVWASAGLLTAHGTDARGRRLYDLDEALSVSESRAQGLNALRSTPKSSTTGLSAGE